MIDFLLGCVCGAGIAVTISRLAWRRALRRARAAEDRRVGYLDGLVTKIREELQAATVDCHQALRRADVYTVGANGAWPDEFRPARDWWKGGLPR